MKILYFSKTRTVHDDRFLEALAQTSHEIMHVFLEPSLRSHPNDNLEGIVCQEVLTGGRCRISWATCLFLTQAVRRIIKRFQPDIVHAGPIQSAGFLAALSGFQPLVTMSWGSDLLVDADRDWWMRWTTLYTLKHTTVLVGDCNAVREKASALGFPPQRTVLFPWGVDLRLFSPDVFKGNILRKKLGWEDTFVVLSVRSWEPLYQVDVTVRGFARAARHEPRLRLLLLGRGSEESKIMNILKDAAVLDRVHIVGHVQPSDLPLFYTAADLYVSSSMSDGSSVSLMEALACGLPALVSDIPGNREWVVPGRQGWFFPVGNAEILSEKMLYATAHPDVMQRARIEARRTAEERADWKNNFRRLLDAYNLATKSLQSGSVVQACL